MRELLIKIIMYRLKLGGSQLDVCQGVMRTLFETTQISQDDAKKAFDQATLPLVDPSQLPCPECGHNHDDQLHYAHLSDGGHSRGRQSHPLPNTKVSSMFE